MRKEKLKILVLAGGESGERDVSLDSAQAIAQTLADSGHSIKVIDTLTGEFFSDEFIQNSEKSTSGSYKIPDDISDTYAEKLISNIISEKSNGLDVIFNGLHGGIGENGMISALLDFLKIPYTGSPMAASAIAMNKDIAKRTMSTLNIPTAYWRVFYSSQQVVGIVNKVSTQFDIPVIIKPVDCGSTVGLSLVEDTVHLSGALEKAFAASNQIMAETYFRGREITIAVLDGKPLPPVEIKPEHKLYDYACKYTKGKSEYFCPADIGEEIVQKLSRDALTFYHTIGCEGYARIDFIVANKDNYICLELNTLPGMTELSLFPMAAKAAGIEFDALLEELCYLAMENRY